MGSYEDDLRTLEVELRGVEQAFRELTHEQWQTPTKLQPLDETQPRWTLFELAGHFDISIGLTVMLMAEPQAGQVGRDRTSFFHAAPPNQAEALAEYPVRYDRSIWGRYRRHRRRLGWALQGRGLAGQGAQP
jgi:hypothetical protein